MKRLALLLCILAIAGCKSKHTQSGTSLPTSLLLPSSSMQTTTVDVNSNHTPDSLYISHHWNNSQSLFDSPSEASISRWKGICEKKSDSFYYSWDIDLYKSNEQLLAIKDLIGIVLCNEDNKPLSYYDDFILWRLSEYIPFESTPQSEIQRFSILETQIDSLLDYTAGDGCQYDYNCWSEISLYLEETLTRTMFRRLVNHVDGNLASLLKLEDDAYWQYHDVQSACFDTVKMSPCFNGTSAPIAYNGMSKDDVLLRRKSIESFLYFLSDGDISTNNFERHIDISLSAVLDEYDRFLAELPANGVDEDPEFPEYYPLTSRQRSMFEDRTAFVRWMSERDKISKLLTGSRKEYFDLSTNNARRHKLFMLKNRYEGYGIGTDEYFDSLLKTESTDRELLDYCFQGII